MNNILLYLELIIIEYIGAAHRQGLGKEFLMVGSVNKTIKFFN